MRVHVPISLRWGDLDAYNHVNNVEVMRILEEARVRTFWRFDESPAEERAPLAVIAGGAGADTVTLIARHEVDYLAPISYRTTPLDVQLWLGGIGGASIEVCYEVFGDGDDEPYLRASSTIVLLDTQSERPRRITDDERAAWQPFVEAPVVLRGRRSA